MHTQSRENSARRPIAGLAALAAPAAMLLGSLAWTTSAQAGNCSPLQVSNLRPISERVIMEGNRPAAVSFRVSATVKNTNPREVYLGNKDTQVSVMASDRDRKRLLAENHIMRTHIAPGGSQRIISDLIILRRKDNRTPLTANLQGVTVNFHCKNQEQVKLVSRSDFKYDLTPALTGGKARRLSGRIRGGSEGTRPPRGRGAPTPRNRTSSVAPRPRG